MTLKSIFMGVVVLIKDGKYLLMREFSVEYLYLDFIRSQEQTIIEMNSAHSKAY